LILRALRESHGSALSVSDEDLLEAQRLLAETEGLWVGPEAAATVAALPALIKRGQAGRDETIVLLLTGSGFKAPGAARRAPIHLSGDPAALPDLLATVLR
ncbi:MAG: pyridoxal-phosphate dependent enzyme, partial [Candidatus Rokubacteria bacterium]|nr:pyridoxal-phosphate dependent enzyme [Candidatus Rokubacteria bacterium]